MPSHKPLVIDPVYWACGKETAENLGGLLFNQKTRKFDIMGWLIHVYAGYGSGDMGNHRIPSTFVREVLGRNYRFPTPVDWLLTKEGDDSEAGKALILINDDITIDQETRMKRITEILSVHGVAVTFTNTKPVPKQETLNLKDFQKDIVNGFYATTTRDELDYDTSDTF
jgi:hypothetical protein